jgi:molybdopterin synthase catalytic subunit
VSVTRFLVTESPLAIEPLAADVETSLRGVDPGCGAVCTFIGYVRATHQGRRVQHLEYEAFVPLAVKSLERIDREVQADWPGTALAIHHRIGRLAIGEASVVIAAASAHRAQAFAACRYAIERIKQITPIWKHEFFEDGQAWVEGATADVEDEAARERARAVACA